MYFSRVLIALAAPFVVCAQSSGPNAFKVPSSGYDVSAGKTVTLEWTPSTSGTVSLYLRQGNSAALSQGVPIATGLQNSGSYSWMVPSDAVRGSGYAVEIVDDSNPSNVNYTPQFALASNNLSSAPASTNSASSTTSASSSATNSASTTGSSASRTGTATSGTTSRPTGANTSGTGLQATSSPSGAAAVPRATAFAGLIGGVALAALAL